jgi:hypothetical protein
MSDAGCMSEKDTSCRCEMYVPTVSRDAVDVIGKSDAWRSIARVRGGREVQLPHNKRTNRLTERGSATNPTEGLPKFTKGEGEGGKVDLALRGRGRSDVRGASCGG